MPENVGGHVGTGAFFLVFGVWWTVLAFWLQLTIKLGINRRDRGTYSTSEINKKSYIPQPFYSKIPVEAILKIIFPTCGIIMATCINAWKDKDNKEHLYWSLYNLHTANGSFEDIGPLQHVTMHSCFFLSAVVDLLSLFIDLPRTTTQLFLFIAFSAEGVTLYFHANDRDGLNLRAHTLQNYANFGCMIFSALRMLQATNLFINAGLALSIVLQGTWVIQIGIILYGQTYWDPDDHHNKMFLVASFLWHVAIIATCMLIVYIVMMMVLKHRRKYHSVHQEEMKLIDVNIKDDLIPLEKVNEESETVT